MPTIECNQQHITFDQPVTVAQALARLLPESHDKPLGAFCEGRVLELGSRLTQDTTLRPITFQDEEGRRIYERSLRFILLLAVHRCYPDVRVRIQRILAKTGKPAVMINRTTELPIFSVSPTTWTDLPLRCSGNTKESLSKTFSARISVSSPNSSTCL